LINFAGSIAGAATTEAVADEVEALFVSGADLSWQPIINATLLMMLAARSIFCDVIRLLSLAGCELPLVISMVLDGWQALGLPVP
jgi:hypothetical protein